MKKIILGALCAMFMLCSCERSSVNECICGKWERTAYDINGEGVVYTYVFGRSGTFVQETMDGVCAVSVNGRYDYVGESEGELRLYDLEVNGVVYHSPNVYRVMIEGDRLYMMTNDCIIQYHR